MASARVRTSSNSNDRGNSAARRVRKQWLLSPESGHGGNGTVVCCYRCEVALDYETITVDRIIPGHDGGTYRRGNIRPACGPCNYSTGGQLGAAVLRAKRELVPA